MTITSKRQATLPAALCEEIGLRPGSRVVLQRRVLDGETVWVLRSRKPDWSWIGAARRYAAMRAQSSLLTITHSDTVALAEVLLLGP